MFSPERYQQIITYYISELMEAQMLASINANKANTNQLIADTAQAEVKELQARHEAYRATMEAAVENLQHAVAQLEAKSVGLALTLEARSLKDLDPPEGIQILDEPKLVPPWTEYAGAGSNPAVPTVAPLPKEMFTDAVPRTYDGGKAFITAGAAASIADRAASSNVVHLTQSLPEPEVTVLSSGEVLAAPRLNQSPDAIY